MMLIPGKHKCLLSQQSLLTHSSSPGSVLHEIISFLFNMSIVVAIIQALFRLAYCCGFMGGVSLPFLGDQSSSRLPDPLALTVIIHPLV